MARMETTKETTMPVTRITTSQEVKFSPNFTIFKRLAPNITGIARKKVYSAATVLEAPTRIPPIMVDPEREVPGIKDST